MLPRSCTGSFATSSGAVYTPASSAVVLPVASVSERIEVPPLQLLDALQHSTAGGGEQVEVTENDDLVVVGEVGCTERIASECRTTPLTEPSKVHTAFKLHGRRRAQYFLSPSTPLLGVTPQPSSVASVSSLLGRSANSIIHLTSPCVDSLYLLPNPTDPTATDIIYHVTPTKSFLPNPIKHVDEIGVDEHGVSYIVLEYARPALIWIILISAVIGLSSKAVVADLMYPPSVDLIVKSTWMTGVSAMCFVLLSIPEVLGGQLDRTVANYLFGKQDAALLRTYLIGAPLPPPRVGGTTMIPCLGLLFVCTAGTLHGLFSAAFLISLANTSLEQCVVLMNLHPVLVLMGRLALSRPMERYGAVVVVIGVVLLYLSSEGSSQAGPRPLLGDIYAFSVSVFVCFYLFVNKKLQEHLPGGFLMVAINVVSWVVQVFFAVLQGNGTWTTDPNNGLLAIFGEHAVPNLLGGVFGGALAYGGFQVAFRYLNPLVVSVNITLEPLFAVVIGIMAGRPSPSPETWTALMVLLSGTIAVALGGKNEKEGKEILLNDEPPVLHT